MHATHEIMNTRKGGITFRRGSVVHQDARYERISEFRTEVKSFVHQDARDNMGITPRCANVKQCKLKALGVAVVDLWLFFEYHVEIKV